MSQADDHRVLLRKHENWLKAVYYEVNRLDPVLLNTAITNLKERGVIE